MPTNQPEIYLDICVLDERQMKRWSTLLGKTQDPEATSFGDNLHNAHVIIIAEGHHFGGNFESSDTTSFIYYYDVAHQ